MTKVRAVVLALGVLASLCGFARPASAGGSVWYFDRPSYEAGDLVVAGASVSWGHYDTLGTPDDGPYGAWIMRVDAQGAWADQRPYAEQIESARYVGDVRIEVGPGEVNGVRYGPNVARVEFRLPRVEPGLYSLLHCNYPCTKMLGDITWGVFWVGEPDPDGVPTSGHSVPSPTPTLPPTTTTVPPPPPTTLPPTTTTVATVPPSRADLSNSRGVPLPVIALGTIALVAAGAVALVSRRARAGAR